MMMKNGREIDIRQSSDNNYFSSKLEFKKNKNNTRKVLYLMRLKI